MHIKHSRQTDMEKILNTLIHKGRFTGAVIATDQGLTVATMGQADADLIAAVAASMRDLAKRTHQHLTEIATMDNHGHKIVSRFFAIGENLILLSVVVPNKCSYRRLMTQAIREIKLSEP